MFGVLVLDDNAMLRMDIAQQLRGAGYRPIMCGTVAAARAAMAGQAVALAILDVLLPDGDGVDLLGELRADPKYAELPIIVLSTEADVRNRIRGMQSGASDYIGKPFDTRVLVASVHRLLGSTPPADNHIVLIAPNNEARRALVMALTHGGFTTTVSASGAEGLRLAASNPPTAIVVDCTVPACLDIVRRLRLDPSIRTTPCLLIGDPAAEAGALDTGADGFTGHDDLDVLLPRLRAVLRSAEEQVAKPSAPKRLLAVHEDDFVIMTERLREQSCDVISVGSTVQAMELLSVQPVDCILLGRGVAEIEFCRAVKESARLRRIPLIVITSQPVYRDALIECLHAGADDFVALASGIDVFVARVQAQLRRKEIEDGQRSMRTLLLRSEVQTAKARAALNNERMEREEAVRQAARAEQEANMFRLLENIPVGIFMLAGDGKPYYANQYAKELLGRGVVLEASPSELAATYQVYVAGTAELYPTARLPIVRALHGERTMVTDMEVRRGADVIPLQVTAVPVINAGRVEFAIAAFQDIRELREAALRDALTGSANRAAFVEAFGRIAPVYQRSKEPLSVALIDLDRFKSVNDTHGHAMGDEVLRRSAGLLEKAIRRGDFFCRWGGEEFAVMLANDCVGGAALLERALDRLREEVFVSPSGESFHVSFSAGLARVEDWTTLDTVIKEADRLLYQAKAAGRGRVCTA